MKIQIFTRSMNYALYLRSQHTLSLPYERRRCLLTTADGYFLRLLSSDADFAINIDEDAFVTDNNVLTELLEYMLENRYVSCGMPDGGIVKIRDHNPLITNPFFNIFDLREIRRKFSLSALKYYETWRDDLTEKAPVSMLRTNWKFDTYEGYSPFFLWLADNFDVLYLDAREHSDGISTILLDHLDRPFLNHSWYSRDYGKDEKQTQRIDQLYRESSKDEWEPNTASLEYRWIHCRDYVLYHHGYRNFHRFNSYWNSAKRRLNQWKSTKGKSL